MRRTTVFVLACALGAFLSAAAASAGSVIRVSPAGNDNSNGLSWAAPKRTVTAGLAATVSGDQVWVAAGTYVERITLKAGVGLYGGFAGTEMTLAERPAFPRTAPDANETILDGNQGGSVVTSPSGATTTTRIDGFTIRNGNGTLSGSYRYGGGIYCPSSSPTITNCTLTGNTGFYGGGMYSQNGNPTLTSCTFSGNTYSGMYNYESSPTVTNCTFSGNTGSGMVNSSSNPTLTNCAFSGNSTYRGGGISNYSSNPTLMNCIFNGNTASADGGGMKNWSSSPTLTNCTFTGNSATYDGGGMWNFDGSSPVLTNCTFSRNVASSDGGGVYNYDNSNAVLTNCTFDGNQASVDGGGLCTFYNSNAMLTACVFSGNSASSRGGGVCNDASFSTLANCTFSGNQANYGGGMCNASGIPVMANCIVWGNAANHGSQLYDYGLTAGVTYNCVQGGWPGEGNVDADPRFVRNADAGADGQWGTEDDNYGDLRLRAGSPCIDAGDNAAVPEDTADLDGDGDTIEPLPLDLIGHARFIDDPATVDTGVGAPPIVDMGACEFKPAVPGDFNDDDAVDAADLLIFEACATGPAILYDAAALPAEPPGCPLIPLDEDKIVADFDADGDVDQADFGVLQTLLIDVP